MKKLIVWDLFGGGQNSVYNALDKEQYDVYTFDVTEPSHEHQFKVDLSQDNIIEVFKQYPIPDIITASPLCQSFSIILAMEGGGTCFWKLNDTKTLLIERSEEEFERLKKGFTKNLDAKTQLFIKRLGEKCINNTLQLIDYYKPRLWYIENPYHSLMWKYLTLNHKDFCNNWHVKLNKACYGQYGYPTSKPTYFMSNVPLELNNKFIEKPYFVKYIDGVKYYVLKANPKVKSKNRTIAVNHLQSGKQKERLTSLQTGEAGERSKIPTLLIQNIFWQFYSILNAGWLF